MCRFAERVFGFIWDYKFYIDLSSFVLGSAYCFPRRWSLSKPSLALQAFPAQSARLCLIRCAQSHTKLRRLPFVPLWKTISWSTLNIPTKVKRYNQVKTTKQNQSPSFLITGPISIMMIRRPYTSLIMSIVEMSWHVSRSNVSTQISS